jgi:hypothetical protein
MRLLLLLVACAASLSAQDPPVRDLRPPAAPPGTAEVRGRVFGADTGAPVPGAVVTLTRAPSLSVTGGFAGMANYHSTEAGDDGRYVFTGVQAGEYYLSAGDAQNRAGYLRSGYGASELRAPGTRVIVAEGQRLDGLDIRLASAAVIAGQVLDETGQPLARIMVFPLRWTGSRAVRIGTAERTDDRGRYRLFGLSPGDYLVAAEAPAGAANTERRTGLLTTYSPAALEVGQARLVRAVGGDVVEADIRMVRARLLRLSGILLDMQGRPVAGSPVTLSRAGSLDGRPPTASTDQQGRFAFRNLAPGPYRLVGRAYFSGRVSPEGGREVAVMDLHLDDDVEDMVVMSQPGGSVRIDVYFESPPPDVMRVSISAVPGERGENLLGGRAPETVTGPGTVVLSDLFGPVLIRTTGMSPRWIVKEIRHRGRDITDVPTVFARQDAVQLVLSDRAATLEGVVTDARGSSAGAGDVVIIFGNDPATWIPQSSNVRMMPVLGGKFTAAGLRPGTYYVAALPFRDAANLSEPSIGAFQALAIHATQVVLGEGETRRIDIQFVEGGVR